MNTTMTPPPTRKLTRSNRDSKVAGVAGGLGEYFGIDPVIFRLAFVVAFFAGGTGLLAYVIAWIVLPESDGSDPAPPAPKGTFSPPVIIGALLVVAGAVTLIDSSSWFGFDVNAPAFIWPIGLIVAGAMLLLRDRNDDGTTDSPAARDDAAPTDATFAAPPSAPGDPLASTAVSLYEGPDPDGIADADIVDPPTTDEPDPAGFRTGPTVAESTPTPPPRRARFSPTRLTFGGLLILFGVLGMAFLFDWFTVSLTASLAIALVITGLGLTAGAIWGGGWPLLPIGIIFGVMLTASAAAGEVDISGGVGEITERPVSAVDDLTFDWGIGEMVIDLRGLADSSDLDAITAINADQGIGELEIIVPDDLGVIISADVGMGAIDIDLPSENVLIEEGGISRDQTLERRDGAEPTLEITADLGIGRIYVHEG